MPEVTNDTARVRELGATLHDLCWRISRFAPAQVGLDPLPASELAVLRAVLDGPGRSVSDVAAAVSMQPSNVSAAIRALVERGLVEKRPDPHDRRVSLLHPTTRALAEREAIEDAVAGTLSAALKTLPAATVDALFGALPAMRELTEEVASRTTGRLGVVHATAQRGRG